VRTWTQRPESGKEGLIGEVGEVRQRIAPQGKVWLHGEYWTAESDEELEVGQKVRVIAVNRMILRVRKATL